MRRWGGERLWRKREGEREKGGYVIRHGLGWYCYSLGWWAGGGDGGGMGGDEGMGKEWMEGTKCWIGRGGSSYQREADPLYLV